MRILLAGLVAGLLLSLSLSAKAGVTKTSLKCTASYGEQMETSSVVVTNPSMTSADFKIGGVTFTASAVYELVNVYAKVGGVTIGNSGKKNASLDVFQDNREPVSLSCALVVKTREYCDE